MKRISMLLAALTLATVAASVAAGGTVVSISFDDDAVGAPPATGGAGQPSFVQVGEGATVLVEEVANGIASQPVVETVPGANVFAFGRCGFSADRVKPGTC